MSDYNELCQFIHAKFPTTIQKINHPCKLQGKYILVGSIPYDLSDPAPTLYNKNHRSSKHWDTEKDAINALLAIGKTTFQLSDCSWYRSGIE